MSNASRQTTNLRRAPLQLFAAGAEAERTFNAIASSEEQNTHGYRVSQAGWDLRRFTQGGPVLLEHNVAEGLLGGHDPATTLPIGRATNVRVEGKVLRAQITIATRAAHPLADLVLAAIRERNLCGISVGFNVLEWGEGKDEDLVKAAELVEISVCATGADPRARIELSARNPGPVERWRGKAYVQLSPMERVELAGRAPAKFHRMQAANNGLDVSRPTKPYAQLSHVEKERLLEYWPDHFRRAQAASK